MDTKNMTDEQLAAEIRARVDSFNEMVAHAAARGIIVELAQEELTDNKDHDYPALTVRVTKEL